jgi:hypothetical protein
MFQYLFRVDKTLQIQIYYIIVINKKKRIIKLDLLFRKIN